MNIQKRNENAFDQQKEKNEGITKSSLYHNSHQTYENR